MQCLYDDRESSIEEATRLVFRSYLVVLRLTFCVRREYTDSRVPWRHATYSGLEYAYYRQSGEKEII